MSVSVLEILSAIEKEGNFRKAAATLGVTQPYLSQVVQRLEKECRGLIVDRHHKPFKLTELGQYYLDTRRRIQNIEEETEQFCSDHANLRTGKLRIASNGERTNAILIPGVSAFAKQYPGIYIELTLEHHLEEISNLLLSGMAEVGVLFQYLLKKGLNAYPLFKERYLFAVPDAQYFADVGERYNSEGRYPRFQDANFEKLSKLPLLQTVLHHERTIARSDKGDAARRNNGTCDIRLYGAPRARRERQDARAHRRGGEEARRNMERLHGRDAEAEPAKNRALQDMRRHIRPHLRHKYDGDGRAEGPSRVRENRRGRTRGARYIQAGGRARAGAHRYDRRRAAPVHQLDGARHQRRACRTDGGARGFHLRARRLRRYLHGGLHHGKRGDSFDGGVGIPLEEKRPVGETAAESRGLHRPRLYVRGLYAARSLRADLLSAARARRLPALRGLRNLPIHLLRLRGAQRALRARLPRDDIHQLRRRRRLLHNRLGRAASARHFDVRRQTIKRQEKIPRAKRGIFRIFCRSSITSRLSSR